MKFLLKIKAWKLFLILIMPMFLMEILIFGAVASGNAAVAMNLIMLGMVVAMMPFMVWWYTIGTHLSSLLPDKMRKNSMPFKIALGYAVAYTFVFAFVMMIIANSSSAPGMVFSLIVPFHLLAMCCMFYTLYCISRAFTILRGNHNPSFIDMAGPFFLFWFFPLGVWFLQPKINEIFRDY